MTATEILTEIESNEAKADSRREDGDLYGLASSHAALADTIADEIVYPARRAKQAVSAEILALALFGRDVATLISTIGSRRQASGLGEIVSPWDRLVAHARRTILDTLFASTPGADA